MQRIKIKDLMALLEIMAHELGTPEGPSYTRHGERDILRAGSARELFNLMHAYRDGYDAAKRGEV